MIGIAAVVILVIVAGVFLMKKGKNETTVATQTQVKRPKTLAEQQRELELQRQSQMPSPATPDLPQTTLQTVQTLNLTTQANNLKMLVDEEQSITARSAAMPHTAEGVESDGLDFDLPGFNNQDNNQDSDKPAINRTLQAAMPSVTKVAQPVTQIDSISSNADDELDFDFALDVPETKSTPVTTATKPTTETTAAQSQSNELTFDDFDFDFSLPDTPSTNAATAVEPMITPPTAAPSGDNNIADEFDFDFDLNAEPAVTPANDATTEPALSFDASNTKASSNLTSDAAISVPVASDEATDIASFALDDELLRQAEAATLATPATPSVAEPVVDLAEVSAPSQSDSLLISDDMFDFMLDDDTTKAQDATSNVLVTEPTPSDDLIDLSFDDTATQATNQTTTTPTASPETPSVADEGSPTTAPVVEDLSAILDVIKDIDTDTLNVDLAEQYVNLGEYDSAKRLLDEIKDSNNTALVERAAALRQRIA
ncbi:hypothetical protein A9Z64_00435 [Moraxella osloensis]|nr:hypothetical protein [Moraxella osloensis]AME02054.1 hypothetical protein AXE82_10050 [Moraxella osloensis]OBX56492.1 hypothetical protein A9Z64_00435 [Moraxella osloensis]QPT42201.1 hypothetical protein I6G27_09610 [Moraxella osloensis]